MTNVAGTQFDMVTPGNEMKWDTTEPSNGSYNFGPGDQIVSWAKAHNDRQPLVPATGPVAVRERLRRQPGLLSP